jgi:hypothetical protein
MIWTNKGSDVERDHPVERLLVIVLGLLLYAISARNPGARPGLFDKMQLTLVLSALIIDVMVLVAITGRITEWGFSPNKTPALGENVISLTNLAWTAWLFRRLCAASYALRPPRTLADPLPHHVRRLGLDSRTRLPARVQLRLGLSRQRTRLTPGAV